MCGLTAQPGAHVVPKAHDQALSRLSLKLCRYHAIVPRLKMPRDDRAYTCVMMYVYTYTYHVD